MLDFENNKYISNKDALLKAYLPHSELSLEQQDNLISNIDKFFFKLEHKVRAWSPSDNDILVIDNEKDLKITICKEFPMSFKWEKGRGGKPNQVFHIDIDGMIARIRSKPSYDELIFKNDPYMKKGDSKIEFIEQIKLIEIHRNLLHNVRYDYNHPTLKEEDKKAIIVDYVKHWQGHLESLLNFIACNVFTSDKKLSWFHIQAYSDFGKSKFMEILKDCRLGHSIDYTDFMTDKPSGLSPVKIRGKAVIVIDEFKVFTNAMFKTSEIMRVRPMRGHHEDVEVGAKLLFSADNSKSLINGVDEQIQNRVLQLKFDKDKNNQKLGERELVIEYGDSYLNTVKEYISNALANKIEYLAKLGKFKAPNKSKEILDPIAKDYRLKQKTLLETIYERIIEGLKNPKDLLIHNPYKERIIEMIEDNIFKNFGEPNSLFIKQPTKIFKEIIILSSDDDFIKKFRYKDMDDIMKMFNKPKSKRFNGKMEKGIEVKVKREPLKVTYEDKNGKVIEEEEVPF